MAGRGAALAAAGRVHGLLAGNGWRLCLRRLSQHRQKHGAARLARFHAGLGRRRDGVAGAQPAAPVGHAQLRGQPLPHRSGSRTDEGDQPRHSPSSTCCWCSGLRAACSDFACRNARSKDSSRTGSPLAVAALWALHPINLMAVLLIVQRMESLGHLFVFAGLWLYAATRMRQLTRKPGGWPALLTALFGFTAVGIPPE